MLAFLLTTCAGVGAYGAIFHPKKDQPVQGDAVLVLGPLDGKIEPAVKLARDGGADALLISSPSREDDGTGECRPEVTGLLQAAGAMNSEFPADVVCFSPDPVTTQGEAMFLREMGTERSWDSVTVVAYSPHVERARILLDRCWEGEVAVTAVNRPMDTGQAIGTYFYQSGAMVKAVLTPSCDSRLPNWLEELGWKLSDTEGRLGSASEIPGD